MDSFGIGGAPDADSFGDLGSDTLGHIAEWFVDRLDRPLKIPNLMRGGLGEAYRIVHGNYPKGLDAVRVGAGWAAATEISTGKDSPSGHWEMAGVPVDWDWGYFPKREDCFPSELLACIHREFGLPGSLGHCHASGTEIVARLGGESIRSGKPIFYTSADSVFQIAAHEESFGLDRLYNLCRLVRQKLMNPIVGRVIARPFLNSNQGFYRTKGRKDFAVEPPHPTVLEKVKGRGYPVVGVGKIGGLFAHQGFSEECQASGHDALWEATKMAGQEGGLVMTNFVDFDTLYGHRRDPEGYGVALERWDLQFGDFLNSLDASDRWLVTADHGNDPTWRGTDHTRERVPVLMKGDGCFGVRSSFTDVGATVGNFFGVKMDVGEAMM